MIRIKAPASAANLGPGFDCMGLALSVYNTYDVQLSDHDELINIEERYNNPDNLFLAAYRKGCEAIGVKDHVRVSFHTEIPSTRGMGSSASFIAAGIAAAGILHDNALGKDEIFQLMSQMEGHPDNTAPCLYGGLTASFQTDDGTYICRKMKLDESWKFTLFIPGYEVSTKEARNALPQFYSRSDAAKSLAGAIFSLEALRTGDLELLKQTARDVIHEPYRAKLIRSFEMIRKTAEEDTGGRLIISGSGPACLLIAKQYLSEAAREKLSAIEEGMKIQNVSAAAGGLLINGEPL